jgi:hypothetical protein
MVPPAGHAQALLSNASQFHPGGPLACHSAATPAAPLSRKTVQIDHTRQDLPRLSKNLPIQVELPAMRTIGAWASIRLVQ